MKRKQPKGRAVRGDVFDVVGRKMAEALIGTADAIDGMSEPFRSGGISALEEFHYRFTGKHFDWGDFKRERGQP